jgi:hypothetical protein
MSLLAAAVLAVLTLIAFALWMKARRELPDPALAVPLRRTRTLFSPAERGALDLLEQAVGAKYRVFGKVRVADVLRPAAALDPEYHAQVWRRLRSRHFDFVLCRPDDLAVVCAVEVSGTHRSNAARARRDALVGALCRIAGLPLLRMQRVGSCSAIELRDQLARTISPLPQQASSTAHSGTQRRA